MTTDPQIADIKARLFSGVTCVFMGRLLAIPTGLIVNALLARLLAPEAMGAYFITASLVSASTLVAQLGLNQTVVRLVSEAISNNSPTRAASAIHITLQCGVLGALAVAVTLAIGPGQWLAEVLFKSELIANIVGLVAIWIVLVAFQNLIAEGFRGFRSIGLATLFGGLVTSILSALMFAALWILKAHSDLQTIVLLSVTASAVSAFLATLVLRSKVKPLKREDDLRHKDVLLIAWPLWLTNITLFILTQADLWILGIYEHQDEVAIYGAAARLVALTAIPLMMLNAVLPPFVSELNVLGKRKDLESILRFSATLAGIPALLLSVSFVLFGKLILGWLYGEFYEVGYTVLVVLGFGQLINVVAGSCGLTLMMTGHQATMMWISIACGLFTVFGALVLVRDYGATGVASTAAIGLVLQNILMLLFTKVKIGVWTHVKWPRTIRFNALRPL